LTASERRKLPVYGYRLCGVARKKQLENLKNLPPSRCAVIQYKGLYGQIHFPACKNPQARKWPGPKIKNIAAG